MADPPAIDSTRRILPADQVPAPRPRGRRPQRRAPEPRPARRRREEDASEPLPHVDEMV